MENMKLSETFKNAIKSDDFLMARGARRENFRNLRWKVSDFSVSQPLVKYPLECPQEKNYTLERSERSSTDAVSRSWRETDIFII